MKISLLPVFLTYQLLIFVVAFLIEDEPEFSNLIIRDDSRFQSVTETSAVLAALGAGLSFGTIFGLLKPTTCPECNADSLQRQLNTANAQLSMVTQELNTATTQLSTVTQELNTVTTQLITVTQQLSACNSDLSSFTSLISQQAACVAIQVVPVCNNNPQCSYECVAQGILDLYAQSGK